MEAGRNVKERGLDNNLLELIAADDAPPNDFGRIAEDHGPKQIRWSCTKSGKRVC